MKKCAYCEEKAPLTREHLTPNWFIQMDKSPDDSGFLEKAPNKFVQNSTIKDVCAKCNNGKLSELDAYGKSLYDEFFSKITLTGETPYFRYDYQKLLKWLLKCSFNTARVHKTDLEVLSHYASYLIGDKPLPDDVLLYCDLISPAQIGDAELGLAEKMYSSDGLIIPNWFRMGVFRVPEFDSIEYCFRSVIINSYQFLLILPKIGSSHKSQRRSLLTAIKKSNAFSVRLPQSGRIQLLPPSIDALQSISGHIYHNLLSYALYDDDDDDSVGAVLKSVKPDFVWVRIPRTDVEEQNTDDIANLFKYVTSAREPALTLMQKVEFSIDGYDDDPRELYEIEDVVRFIGKLNAVFPYWLFFCRPKSIWLNIVLAALSQSSIEKDWGSKKTVRISSQHLEKHVYNWFGALNELSHQLVISETLNKKISDDFNELLLTFYNSTN